MAIHPTDYVVIRKQSTHWAAGVQSDPDPGPFTFTLPPKTMPTDPSVLYFVLSLSDVDESVKLRIRLNGKNIWNGTFGDISRWGTFHTIIGKGVIKPGENTLNFDMYDYAEDDLKIDALFSEVVLFYKVRELV